MKVPSCLQIHWPSVAVAFSSVGLQLLTSTMGFYYIKVFVTKFYITPAWLNLVQILYGIWNAIDDPLGGYCQDFGVCGIEWIRDRKKVVLFGSVPIVVGYMMLWIPWYNIPSNCTIPNITDVNLEEDNIDDITCTPDAPNWLVALHLLVALLIYDLFSSLITSAQCGLFTEMTTEHAGRVRVVKYMGIASMLATLVIFPLDYISQGLQHYVNFEIGVAVVAAVSFSTFIYSGIMSPSPQSHYQSEEETVDETLTFRHALRARLLTFKQIFTNSDWLCIVAVNFVHTMRVTANINFLAIFTEGLVSAKLLPKGSKSIGLFYAACNTAPLLCIFILSPLMERFGVWSVLMGSLAATAVNCIIAVSVGRHYERMIVAFLFIDCILGQSLWPAAFNIFFPTIAEADYRKYKRKTPLSTMIFTFNSLLTKPAVSIAPILMTNILNTKHYSEFVKSPHTITVTEHTELLNMMFLLVCLYPLVAAMLEAVLLLPYKMKFNHKMVDVVAPAPPDLEITRF